MGEHQAKHDRHHDQTTEVADQHQRRHRMRLLAILLGHQVVEHRRRQGSEHPQRRGLESL